MIKLNPRNPTRIPTPFQAGGGALAGAAAGMLLGVFFHKALVLAIGLGVTGWIVGALVDRSRR